MLENSEVVEHTHRIGGSITIFNIVQKVPSL